MPKINKTTESENVSPHSLEGMPSEIQHRIARFAGRQGENTMMLLNRDFHRRLAAFRAQQYRDEIADMLRCFGVRTNIDALITPNMPAVALRGIAACLSHLYEVWNISVVHYIPSGPFSGLTAALKKTITLLRENPSEFFSCAINNNLPTEFTPENPPIFEAFIIGLLFNNNLLTKAIFEFNDGKLCTGWLENKNQAEAFFIAVCIAGQQELMASILQQHRLLNAARGDTDYESPLSGDRISQVFYVAARFGHLETMQWLWANSPKEQQQVMLAAKSFEAIRSAAKNGRLKTVQWLWTVCPEEQQQTMLAAAGFDAFCKAAHSGHLDTAQWLWSVCPEEQQQAMLAAEGFRAFRLAAANGRLKTVQWLWLVCPEEQQQTMLAAEGFRAFRCAAGNGHLETAQWLRSVCPGGEQQIMLASNGFLVFPYVAGRGHLKTAQWFWSVCAEEQQQIMLVAWDFRAFRNAAGDGHLDTAQWLWVICSEEQQQVMLAAKSFGAFHDAAKNGHLEILQWLWAICHEEQQQTMLAAWGFQAFRDAADRGYLNVAQWLWSQASIENKQQIRQESFFEKLPEEFRQTLLSELSLPEEAPQPEFAQTSMCLVL